jgi:predicted O-methyltransferase YrrM
VADRAALRGYIRSVYDSGFVTGEVGRRIPLEPVGTQERQGEYIRDLAVELGAKRILETGLGLGLSSLFLCEALLASGDPDVHLVTSDPLQKEIFDDAGLLTLRNAGVDELWEFHRAPSMLVLPRLVDEGLKRPGAGADALNLGTVSAFDFAMIDGDHRFEGAFLDIYYAMGLVRPGGLIVVDDYWMPAVRLAVSYFEKNMGLERLPGAVDTGKRSVKRLLRKGWKPRAVVLRRPDKVVFRPHDHFVRFA